MPIKRTRKLTPNLITSGSFTGSFKGTGSYARNALTASYALNASGGGSGSSGTSGQNGSSGTSGSSGSTGSSGSSGSSGTSGSSGSTGSSGTSGSSGSTGSSGTSGTGSSGTSGTSSTSTVTVQTGSISKQTIWNNVVSGSQLTINNLNLSGNKWDVRVIEEWDQKNIVGDIYFNSCSLLLHCNGTNGSTTFTDNSPSNRTVTSNNGASISTAQSKYGGASGLFDGTNDYLTATVTNGLGSGNFTLEFYYYKTTDSGMLFNSRTGGTGGDGIDISHELGTTRAGSVIFNATSVSTNKWNHVAIVRNGSTMTRYLNGVSNATATDSTDFSGTSFFIGGNTGGNVGYLNGYIDEFRFTKGVARYTSNFATSSAQFPDAANITQSLTRYVGTVGGFNDRTTDYGVRKINDTSLRIVKMTTPSVPFPSGSLSASIDRVYVNVLDFTKVSVTSSYATNALTASYLNKISQSLTPSKDNFYSLGSATRKWKDLYVSTASIFLGTNQLRVVRKNNSPQLIFNTSSVVMVPSGSNTNTASYANRALTASYALNASGGGGGGGVTVQTGSISKQTIWNNVVSGSQLTINNLNLSGNKWDVGVIEEWDVASIPGDTYYDNVSLLMHFNGSNGSTTMVDNSKYNATVTVIGNAQISTAQSKFGGGSLYLDGSGDRLNLSSRTQFGVSAGDFTIEGWFYPLVLKNGNCVLSLGTGNSALYWVLYIGRDNGSVLFQTSDGTWTIGAEYSTSANTISINTWQHVAVVRSGTTLKIYIDGSGTTFNSANFGSGTGGTLHIGTYFNAVAAGYDFYGYIDDLRITYGTARYTSNFTPPTSEFLNNSTVSQSLTKYVGTVGGLNDRNVDYGVQKLSDTSLKVVKMTTPSAPYPSGSLSASIDRVYVNVLDYNKVSVTSSYATNSLTASYSNRSLTSSYANRALTSSYSLNLRNIKINGSNLGIGTSNPISLLQVSSSFNDIRIDNGSGNASIRIYGYNQGGGSGFHQFLEVKHTLSSATNPYKYFRLTNVGTIEIINSAYTTAIFSLTNAGVLSTPGGGTSDKRVKNNIQPITENTLPIIEKLEPVKFQFKSNPNIIRHGFVAQDVLNIKPDLVLGDGDQEGGTYGLDYDGLLALTIKALQEANIKIKQLEQRIIQLENK